MVHSLHSRAIICISDFSDQIDYYVYIYVIYSEFMWAQVHFDSTLLLFILFQIFKHTSKRLIAPWGVKPLTIALHNTKTNVSKWLFSLYRICNLFLSLDFDAIETERRWTTKNKEYWYIYLNRSWMDENELLWKMIITCHFEENFSCLVRRDAHHAIRGLTM